MDEQEEQQTRAWVEAWRTAGAALEEIRAEELRALTEEDAGRICAGLAYDPETLWISPERATSAGFIEQQRLFMLSDEHPARHRSRA